MSRIIFLAALAAAVLSACAAPAAAPPAADPQTPIAITVYRSPT